MVTAKQLEQKCIELKKELVSVSTDILRRFPISDYLNDIKSSKRCGKLLNLRRTRSRKRKFEKIASQYGERAAQLYLKVALCCIISDSLEHLSQENIPGEIVDIYHLYFEAVLKDLSTRADEYYDHRSIVLLTDIKICSLRDVPVGGAWMIETRRVNFRPLVGGGIKQFWDYLAFVIFKCGGLAPYYTHHTVPRYIRRFSEKEMNLAYLRIAKLMKLNRNIKGLHTRSWFFDPQLEHISPHLAYLRQSPLQNGAKLFASGATKLDIKLALLISPKRWQLHKQGKYTPTTYTLIWPREEFLRWADKTDGHLSTL